MKLCHRTTVTLGSLADIKWHVPFQRLAIEEGLDAPDGPRSRLRAANAISKPTLRPASSFDRAKEPSTIGRQSMRVLRRPQPEYLP